MAVLICCAVCLGKACVSPAASPATSGAEKEVPFEIPTVPSRNPTSVDPPIATTSGLIRLSKLGPMELKEDKVPTAFTEPTVKMESASAGAVMNFHAFAPSFPALMVQIIPLLAAQEAAFETSVVLPFKS